MAIRHLQGNRLEIVMEDYEDIDTILNADEFIDKYRIWQEFAAKQVLENIRCFTENDELLANNTNIENNKMLLLLKELISSSSSLGVQLILLEALFLLATKFPQRNLFNYGIVQLVNYIKYTRFNQVIIAALKYLAELKNKSQYYDIDKKVIRRIDIDSLLTRVVTNSKEDVNSATMNNYQGEVMKLYNTIYSKTLMSDNGIFNNPEFSTNIPSLVTEYIIDLQQQIQELSRMGNAATKEQQETKEQERKGIEQEVKQEAKQEWRLLAHAQADTKSIMMKSESKESGQLIEDYHASGTSSRDRLLLAIDDVEEVKSISSRMSTPSAKPIVSDSVALEKIIKLLTSVDTSVRTYALDKLVKMSTNNTSSKSSIGSNSDVDRSLNTLISAGPKGEQDLTELVSALMLCLQAALHRRAAASNGLIDELPQFNEGTLSSSISEKALASFSADDTFRSTHHSENMYETMKPLPLNNNTSTAELLISSALLSPHTDIASIKKCILCINSIISMSFEWKNITTKTLTEWSRLLLTLTHAPSDMEDIAESCAQYVLDIIGLTAGGWPATKLRIESTALDKFLLEYNNLIFGDEAKSNPKQYRALMALSYISSLKLNTGSSTQSLPTTLTQRISHTKSFHSLHSNDGSSNEFLEELLLGNSNKLLHVCWNLILGKKEKATAMDLQIQSFAMDILATSSVRLAIREFLLRQQAIGKLILLLHEVGMKLNAVGSTLQGTVDAHINGKTCYELLLTRSTIKALTNLSTSNNNIMSQVRHVLVLGNHINTSNRELLHMFTTSNKVLRQLSQLDETFGYYYDIIASFKDDLVTGDTSGQKSLEKAEKEMKESSDIDDMKDEYHPVYNLDHDGVAQRAWNLVKQKYKHK